MCGMWQSRGQDPVSNYSQMHMVDAARAKFAAGDLLIMLHFRCSVLCGAAYECDMDDEARDLIATHLDVARNLIRDHVSFRELGADSLDLVSLTMAFEEQFDVPISDQEAEACASVGDVITLLSRRMVERTVPQLAHAQG